MRWSAWNVAQFARGAGFEGGALVDATALALAVSGGDDAYRHVIEPGPIHDERGLWGIDVATWPQLGDYALGDPAVNAAVAEALYNDAGATFWWSPVWRAGIDAKWLQRATQAAGQAVDPATLPDPFAPTPVSDAGIAALGVVTQVASTIHGMLGEGSR